VKKIILALIIIFILTGCEVRELVESQDLPVLEVALNTELSNEHEVEEFKFTTTYSTGNYDINEWLVTDSKTLILNATVSNVPKGTEVFIEHVHVDISLASQDAQLNGLTQDSMDDTYHGYQQEGLLITETYPYKEAFAIEGFSKDIIEGWSWYVGSYGSGSISSKRLTETNLIKEGLVYGNKVQVIYNLSIKYTGEEYFHSYTVLDEFYIKTTYLKSN